MNCNANPNFSVPNKPSYYVQSSQLIFLKVPYIPILYIFSLRTPYSLITSFDGSMAIFCEEPIKENAHLMRFLNVVQAVQGNSTMFIFGNFTPIDTICLV